MIDTYIASKDKATLIRFCGFFVNSVPVQKGRAASPEVIDAESGSVFVAEEAVGDPDTYYSCIRAPFELSAVDGIEVVSKETGQSVVGVWLGNCGGVQ